MYREIFVPCVLGRFPETAMATAVALAEVADGRLVALAGASIVAPVATAWLYYPAQVYATMQETADATVGRLADAVRERLAPETVRWEVRSTDRIWLTPGEQAVPHTRFADVVVLGLDRELADFEDRLFSALLVEGGAPLLAVPSGGAASTFQRAVIAWKGTREASRAVHDALPLLIRSASVDVLMVEPEPKDERRGHAPEALIVSHLQRHGIRPNVVRRCDVDGGTGPVILDHAREANADYIVAGGYGRRRASEFVFGGVTRTLMKHSPIPVLFAH
ncbi:universal stress protein [Lysobacter arvi]|uniref:Universal stress protein n=1 Tax=Lysobacter arvi TaxID=3038776 RepID=A0ABU1CCS6_9GAMM|nr:universal stress protein [Lysobacter arvi]MDR0181970.1 universal stress protein [Lysobacter arvi]